MKRYRVQVSNHLGVVQRAFGMGRVTHWGPWKTRHSYDGELEATLRFRELAGRGLHRVRIVHGNEVLAKSM